MLCLHARGVVNKKNMERKIMSEILLITLKIFGWICVGEVGTNFTMQTISYSFYKGDKKIESVLFKPEKIDYTESLSGYGLNVNNQSDNVILMFGGSNYVAYNAIGEFGGYYDCPVFAVDYYGTQESSGHMNLKTMQKATLELYDWVQEKFPNKKITIIGHSYGCGMAAYLASIKKCENLILISGYRDLSDLYNKIIPIFWGPFKLFITNNINVKKYAKHTSDCKVYIFGSNADKTLSAKLQKKLSYCYRDASLKIYTDISHEDYLKNNRVIEDIKEIMNIHKM